MDKRGHRRERPPSDQLLLRLSPQGWAWECMRRNTAYGQYVSEFSNTHRKIVSVQPRFSIIEAVPCTSDTWPICFPEAANRFYGRAAVFWRPDADDSVLPVSAIPARKAQRNGDLLDILQLSLRVTVLKTDTDGEHVRICDGVHSIQLHVREGSILDGPVRLAHLMDDVDGLRKRFVTLQRLAALQRFRRLPSALFPPDSRGPRWLLALKAIDLERAGFSHAEIAHRLYNVDVAESISSDWSRSRVRRLLNNARNLIDGGFRNILTDDPRATADGE